MRMGFSSIFAHTDVLVRLVFAVCRLGGEAGFGERLRGRVVDLFAAGTASRAGSQDGGGVDFLVVFL